MGKLPIALNKITEVQFGSTELEGYKCPKTECLVVNGYIDSKDELGSDRIVYIECTSGSSCHGKCVLLQSMLGHEYTVDNLTVRHRGGGKGQIMDDILEDFQDSSMKSIQIPIKTNKADETTYPAKVKKAFVVFKDLEMYDTELEPAVIAKIKSGEFVERYVLTVKKIGGPMERTKKEKILKAFKSFKSSFGSNGN